MNHLCPLVCAVAVSGCASTASQSSSPPATSAAATAPSAAPKVHSAGAFGAVAVDLVALLPEVKSYCASLERAAQPSHCTMWSEDEAAPTTVCRAGASHTDDCLWPVYLGESHPDHAVRFATMWVNPTSRAVIAVSDFACGRMPLAVWRAWRAKVAAAPQDQAPDCPAEASF